MITQVFGEDVNLLKGSLYFQPHGAPPHYDMGVRKYFNQHFPGRWIDREGSIN